MPRHRDRRAAGLQAFHDDVAFLLGRPNPPSLAAGDDLVRRLAHTHTIGRMSVLGIGDPR